MEAATYESIAGRPDTWPPDIFALDPYLLALEPRPTAATYESICGRPETWPPDAFEDDPYKPAPAITSFVPASAVVGGANFTLRILGTGFNEDTTIVWNNVKMASAFVSVTEVTIPVTMAGLAVGSVPVQAISATGLPSGAASFPITAT